MDRFEELKVVELGEKIGYKKGFEDAKKQFERPRGEWQTLITKGTEKEPIAWKCSVCGKSPVFAVKSDFCPRCGADMREGEV